MALPPTPLDELVRDAELIIVARGLKVLHTDPEPEQYYPPTWPPGFPKPPGWSRALPRQVVEVAVERVLLGGRSSIEPSVIIIQTAGHGSGSSEALLLFLRAGAGSDTYAELTYTFGSSGRFTESDLLRLADAYSSVRHRARALVSRHERVLARKLAVVRDR